MAASWCSTTPSTWRSRRASPWSSAPPNPAANARRAASARCAAWRSLDHIIAGEQGRGNLELLRDLCHTMKFGSLCALGGFIPYPVMSALEHFPEDFRPCAARRRNDEFERHPCP